MEAALLCEGLVIKYQQRYFRNKCLWAFFQIFAILFALATPVLILWSSVPPIAQAIPSALAALCSALLGTFRWRENASRARATAQALEAEAFKYRTRVSSLYNPSLSEHDALANFIHAVNVIARRDIVHAGEWTIDIEGGSSYYTGQPPVLASTTPQALRGGVPAAQPGPPFNYGSGPIDARRARPSGRIQAAPPNPPITHNNVISNTTNSNDNVTATATRAVSSPEGVLSVNGSPVVDVRTVARRLSVDEVDRDESYPVITTDITGEMGLGSNYTATESNNASAISGNMLPHPNATTSTHAGESTQTNNSMMHTPQQQQQQSGVVGRERPVHNKISAIQRTRAPYTPSTPSMLMGDAGPDSPVGNVAAQLQESSIAHAERTDGDWDTSMSSGGWDFSIVGGGSRVNGSTAAAIVSNSMIDSPNGAWQPKGDTLVPPQSTKRTILMYSDPPLATQSPVQASPLPASGSAPPLSAAVSMVEEFDDEDDEPAHLVATKACTCSGECGCESAPLLSISGSSSTNTSTESGSVGNYGTAA